MNITNKDQKNNMYIETVEYWDDLCPESWKLVLPEYNLKLVEAKKIDDSLTILTVKTEIAENLQDFLDDLDEGDLEPLDLISKDYEDDDDYVACLNRKISQLEKIS